MAMTVNGTSEGLFVDMYVFVLTSFASEVQGGARPHAPGSTDGHRQDMATHPNPPTPYPKTAQL